MFRNFFLSLLIGAVPCAIMTGEQASAAVQIKIRANTDPEIVEYRCSDKSDLYFVDRNNKKMNTSFSFAIQQSASAMGTRRDSLIVVWNVEKMAIFQGAIGNFEKVGENRAPVIPLAGGEQFYLRTSEAMNAYRAVSNRIHDSSTGEKSKNDVLLSYKSLVRKDIDTSEIDLLAIVMQYYAQDKLLTVKFKDEILYRPSFAQYASVWLRSHKNYMYAGLIGLAGLACYCMLNSKPPTIKHTL